MTTITNLQNILNSLQTKDQTYQIYDRGEAYVRLHAETNSSAAVLEGNISTFSGILGGAAFLANYILADKAKYSDVSYSYSMENQAGQPNDIYVMSQLIAVDHVRTAIFDYNDPAGNKGSLTLSQGIQAARNTWTANGMQDQFPGQIFGIVEGNVVAPIPGLGFYVKGAADGKIASLSGMAGSILFGKSVSDYVGLSNYKTINGPDSANNDFWGVQRYVVRVDPNNNAGDRDNNGAIDYNDGVVAMIDSAGMHVDNTASYTAINVHLLGFSLFYGVPINTYALNWDGYRNWSLMKQFRIQQVEGGEYDFEKYTAQYGIGIEKDFWGYAEILLNDKQGVVRNAIYLYDRTESGTDNDDYLYGGVGEDNLSGGAGNDVIRSGWWDDKLYGGSGDDKLYAERGNDFLVGGSGTDILDGGDDFDTADYSADPAKVTVTLNDAGISVKDGYGGTDKLISIENIILTKFDDVVETKYISTYPAGQTGKTTIDGGAGNDTYIANVYDTKTNTVYDPLGMGSIELKNFEKVTSTTYLINPVSSVILNTPYYSGTETGNASFDWSTSKYAAQFNFTGSPATSSVTVGGVTQTGPFVDYGSTFGSRIYDGFYAIRGTNHGDTYNLTFEGLGVSSGYHIEYSIITGTGNDVVKTDLVNIWGRDVVKPGTGGGISYGSSGPFGMTIVYTGGNDVYYIDKVSHEIRLSGGYMVSDIKSITQSGSIKYQPDDGYYGSDEGQVTAIITFKNNQTLKIVSDTFWPTRITDDIGGRVVLENVRDSSTSAWAHPVYEIHDRENSWHIPVVGSWGDDTWTKFYTEDAVYYGLGGNDKVNTGAGNNTIYGGLGNDTITAGNGNNRIFGGEDNDTIVAGNGANYIDGGDGNDTVSYAGMGAGITIDRAKGTITHGGKTDTLIGIEGVIGTKYKDTDIGTIGNDFYTLSGGKDTITESGGIDTILLPQAVSFENLTFAKAGNNLKIIQVAGVDETTIVGHFEADKAKAIENLVLTDGFTFDLLNYTKWLYASTNLDGDRNNTVNINLADTIIGNASDNIINGYDQNDTLYGGGGNDQLFGGTGNDLIHGGAGNDIINGGIGSDKLWGGTGDDIFEFKTGDTSITIPDIIQEDAGNGIDQIKLTGGILPANVKFWTDEDGSLRLRYSGTDEIVIKGARDAAGQNITATIMEKIVFDNGTVWDFSTGYNMIDTDESHFLIGGSAADNLQGRGGNDHLIGWDGNDTLIGGTGNDDLNGGSGSDVLSGDAGNDFLYGGSGNDRLTGGIGADTLSGGDGNDTYIFKIGDTLVNTDMLIEQVNGGTDTIKLTGGILSTNVKVWATLDQSIHIQYSAGDEIILKNAYDLRAGAAFKPIWEKISFDDGTIWDITKIGLIKGTAANDLINGFEHAETIEGDAGIDQLHGNGGDDILYGGIGNDSLFGENGNDTLNGGIGTEYLVGGEGNDTYIFAAGDSLNAAPDIISEDVQGGIDTIRLTGGILASNVNFMNDGQRIYLQYTANDRIQLTYPSTSLTVEKVMFDDGTVWDLKTGIRFTGTDLANTMYGTSAPDYMDAKGGNDSLYGYAGNDTLDGGTGNDTLYGGADDDTYIFNTGYGTDVVSDEGGINDVIRIGSGITGADIRFERNGTNLIVYVGAADKIQINNQFYDETYGTNQTYEIEKLILSNGTAYNLMGTLTYKGTDTVNTMNGTKVADILQGLGGGDIIYGKEGNDTLEGGLGNDTLYGGTDNDTYVFNKGDGVDTISEESGTNDIIKLGSTIGATDIRFERSGINLIIYIGATDKIQINSQFYDETYGTNQTYEIEKLLLSDGTTYNLTGSLTFKGTDAVNTMEGTAMADTLLGMGGADTINARAGDDRIEGGVGNDVLNGGAGNDTYIFNKGDGADTISDTDGTNDIITLGAGITASDIRFEKSGAALIIYAGATDKIQINNQFYDETYGTNQPYEIEKMTLSDGTVFDLTTGLTFTGTAKAETIYGTKLGDTIYGMAGADILYGRDGNDILYGGEGNDSLYGEAGNDILYADGGVDTLSGGIGSDIFVFSKDTAFLSKDIISDFKLAENDKINIKDLLIGYDPLTKVIADFVEITTSGSSSILKIDADGGANSFIQIATINGITGLTDEQALVNSGNLIVS